MGLCGGVVNQETGSESFFRLIPSVPSLGYFRSLFRCSSCVYPLPLISVTVKLISIKFQINLFTWHDPPSIGPLGGLLSILSTWQNVPLFVLPIGIRFSCCWSPLHCGDIRYGTHSLNLPKTDAIHFPELDVCCFCVVGITDTPPLGHSSFLY